MCMLVNRRGTRCISRRPAKSIDATGNGDHGETSGAHLLYQADPNKLETFRTKSPLRPPEDPRPLARDSLTLGVLKQGEQPRSDS